MPLRDYALTRLPPWLLDALGTAWGRALGDVKDALAALLKERVGARMPIRPGAAELAPYAPTGALEATGRDRLMPRATGEPDAGYAARLADAWTIHRDGGTARGALRALRAAGYPEAMLVIRSQRLYRLDANGELVVQLLPPGSWSFEQEPQAFWSRYAVLFSYENLPPAWASPVTRTLGARETLSGNGRIRTVTLSSMRTLVDQNGSIEPLGLLTGGFVPDIMDGTVSLDVVLGSPDYTFAWSIGGVLQQSSVAMFPGGAEVPSPLVLAGGTSSGVAAEWVDGEPYAPGDAWEFDVDVGLGAILPSTPPALAVTGPLAFLGSVFVTVAQGAPGYTFSYSVAGAPLRTVSMARGTAVALLLADNSASGVSVTWDNVSTHYPGAAWRWQVADSYPVPGEESREMNLIRALTKEWSNAAATLQGLYIVTAGRALGYPVRTLGAADGRTLGAVTRVLNYHP